MRTTVETIQSHKNASEPLVCLTAYTVCMASILDRHCDVLLVGDSVGMVLYGLPGTQGVTLDMMVNHARAVANTARSACVVVDMPYGSYEHNAGEALRNAQRLMAETGADAVKLEGGIEQANTIALLVENAIPVMGHIGLMPQSFGEGEPFRVQGKTDAQSAALMADAKAVEAAGAFSIVIEGTIEAVAQTLTRSIDIPTIGIGASIACDGQILVTDDMLGLTTGHVPKFVKPYANLSDSIEQAVSHYADEVRARRFPTDAHIYKGG